MTLALPFLTAQPGNGVKQGKSVSSPTATYLVFSERGVLGRRERYYFTEFTWRNSLGNPRSVTRTQVVRAFEILWQRYLRIKQCYDTLSNWWLYAPEDAVPMREVRNELRERLRGLYWTVATMRHQLNFLAHCENAGHVPDAWTYIPGVALELFPITATSESIPGSRFQHYRNVQTIDDFTFRAAAYIHTHGEPPVDPRTEELAALAVRLSSDARGWKLG